MVFDQLKSRIERFSNIRILDLLFDDYKYLNKDTFTAEKAYHDITRLNFEHKAQQDRIEYKQDRKLVKA